MPIVEAARLEAAAAPGQTLANAIVRTLVGSRGGYRFRDVGALTLKGIPDPLPAVELLGDDVRDPLPDEPRPRNVRRWPVVGAVVLLVIVLAGLGLARARSHSSPQTAASTGVVAPKNYVPQYREVFVSGRRRPGGPGRHVRDTHGPAGSIEADWQADHLAGLSRARGYRARRSRRASTCAVVTPATRSLAIMRS